MTTCAVLFDLDDTLILDETINREAFEATALVARDLAGADPTRFTRSAIEATRRLWRSCPFLDYCQSIGISAEECLWGDFSSDNPTVSGLRVWSATFRVQVFEAALQDQSLEPLDDAPLLAETFAKTRRKRLRLMPDALETLAVLKKNFRLALLTNGDRAVQTEKLRASGLAPLFDSVTVSGPHGIGKPSPEIFRIALASIACEPSHACMVGNSLARDIQGARAAGLSAAIWLRVPGSEEFADVRPDFEIPGLHQLPSLIENHFQNLLPTRQPAALQ